MSPFSFIAIAACAAIVLAGTTDGLIFTTCYYGNSVCSGTTVSQSYCERQSVLMNGGPCTGGCFDYSPAHGLAECGGVTAGDCTQARPYGCGASRTGSCEAGSIRITGCRSGSLNAGGGSPTIPATAPPTSPEHYTLTYGVCVHPIQSPLECSEAAGNLGYGAQAARLDNNTAREASTDPDGCYVERGTLYFGTDHMTGWRNTGRCSGTDVCICRSHGYDLPSDDDDEGLPIGAVAAYIVLGLVGCCVTYKLWMMCCIGTPRIGPAQ